MWILGQVRKPEYNHSLRVIHDTLWICQKADNKNACFQNHSTITPNLFYNHSKSLLQTQLPLNIIWTSQQLASNPCFFCRLNHSNPSNSAFFCPCKPPRRCHHHDWRCHLWLWPGLELVLRTRNGRLTARRVGGAVCLERLFPLNNTLKSGFWRCFGSLLRVKTRFFFFFSDADYSAFASFGYVVV